MAKNGKKESWGWTLTKFAAVAVGGAVVGAYGVRAVDSYFMGKYGHRPFEGGGGGGDGDEPAEGNPRIQPQAIAPVLPLFPIVSPQMMPPPVMQIAGHGFSAVPSTVTEMPRENGRGRRSERAAELAEKRERDFDDLVSRFESGEI